MQRALLLGIVLGVLCAIIGSYMIVQRMGMLAHAISHSVMAGLPIAYFPFRPPLGVVFTAVAIVGASSRATFAIPAVIASGTMERDRLIRF